MSFSLKKGYDWFWWLVSGILLLNDQHSSAIITRLHPTSFLIVEVWKYWWNRLLYYLLNQDFQANNLDVNLESRVSYSCCIPDFDIYLTALQRNSFSVDICDYPLVYVHISERKPRFFFSKFVVASKAPDHFSRMWFVVQHKILSSILH